MEDSQKASLGCGTLVLMALAVLAGGVFPPAAEGQPAPARQGNFGDVLKGRAAPDLATLARRASPETTGQETQEAFLDIVQLRETGDRNAVPVLSRILDSNAGTGRIHGYAAAQALFCIGGEEALAALDKRLLQLDDYNAELGSLYVFHWDMPEPKRSQFIQRYFLRNIGKDVQVTMSAKPQDEGGSIRFALTIKNVSAKPLGIWIPAIRNLLVRSGDGQFVRWQEAGIDEYALRAKGVTLQPGQSETVDAVGTTQALAGEPTGAPKDAAIVLRVGVMNYYFSKPGPIQVFFVFEQLPMPAPAKARRKIENAWVGRAVSDPVAITLARPRLAATPPTPSPAGRAEAVRRDERLAEILKLDAERLHVEDSLAHAIAANAPPQEIADLASKRDRLAELIAGLSAAPDTAPVPGSLTKPRTANQPATQAGAGRFNKAVVAIRVDASGRFLPPDMRIAVTLMDGKEIETLAGFFPGMGTGLGSPRAGGWETAMEILFHSPDGKSIRVTVSPEGEAPTVWSEGKGEWPVRGNIKVQREALRKRAKVVAEPIEGQAWGLEADGLRVRLSPEKVAGEAGKPLVLTADIRTTAKWSVPLDQTHCKLEVDGEMYLRRRDGDRKSWSVGGKSELHGGIRVDIDSRWFREQATGRFLELTPGKHTIRLAVQPAPVEQGLALVPGQAFSNPVEIEVLPAASSPSTRPATSGPGSSTRAGAAGSGETPSPASQSTAGRVPALISQLGSVSWKEQQAAEEELVRIGEAAVGALREAAGGQGEKTSRAGAALTKVQEARVLRCFEGRDLSRIVPPTLKFEAPGLPVGSIFSGDPAVRARWVEVLGEIGDQRTAEFVVDALEDSDAVVREAAGEALRKMTGEMMGDEAPRWRAWWQKVRHPTEKPEALLAMLDDPRVEVRRRAIWKLGWLADPATVDPLIERFVGRKGGAVSGAAVYKDEKQLSQDCPHLQVALILIGAPAAERLIAVAGYGWRIRTLAAEALVQIRPPGALLVKALNGSDREAKEGATKVVTVLKPLEAVGPLIRGAPDSNGRFL
ncbi:MAG: HEAT repeat domain-containing protein, partial [Planctomycetota bacterium]|nr:HEAT repeat domain-containing protein [Planctomycetota bacterium]